MAEWKPICGVGGEAHTVGYRRGVHQSWPITDRPIHYGPFVVGGQCPPYAPLQAVPGGYSCVETPGYVARERAVDRLVQSGVHPILAWAEASNRFDVLGLGADEPAAPAAVSTGELATTMVLRGAVGTLIGAAAGPRGREGIWGAAGFVMGAAFGEIGVVGVALAALWRKAG